MRTIALRCGSPNDLVLSGFVEKKHIRGRDMPRREVNPCGEQGIGSMVEAAAGVMS